MTQTLKVYSDKPLPWDKNKIVYGNVSRRARNWMSGPTHRINEQRIPGYTGHIKGMESENLFGTTYGSLTSKAFTKRHPIGHDLNPKNKFKSHFKESYNAKNFRRIRKYKF